jgi:hypothetical protein
VLNLTRLRELARIPREPSADLGYRPWAMFRKDRRAWEDAMRTGTLVLTSVVQANRVLYSAGNQMSAPAVVLYTTSPGRALDVNWLQDLTDLLRLFRQDPDPQDPEAKEVQRLLLDEQSHFTVTLPASLTGGVPVIMQVVTLVPESLPDGCIPLHRLIPSIVDRDGNLWDLKPGAYK